MGAIGIEIASELGLRLEQWRSEQGGRRKLPDAIWAEAARLARRFGFAPVAPVLRMNAAELRRQSVAPGPRLVEPVMPAAMASARWR